jgi:acyl carrier protein
MNVDTNIPKTEDEARLLIINRLGELFCDIFDDESLEIKGDMTAEDVDDWDSVTHITLMVAVESEFDIQMNASEVSELESVNDLINLIAKYTLT